MYRALIVLFVFFLSACNDDVSNFSSCPSVYDDLNWGAYGEFSFGDEGGNAMARRLVEECSWHVDEGQLDSRGGLLKVSSEGDDISFFWFNDSFYAFQVKNNWSGKTDSGAKLGHHISTFYVLHPEFYVADSRVSIFNNSRKGIKVYAYFDGDGYLYNLQVISYH